MRPLMSLPSASVSFDFVAHELMRLDVFAQPDNFAFAVRHLNADGGSCRPCARPECSPLSARGKIVGQAGDPAVLDARFGLEFKGGDDRAGIDLRNLSVHLKFGVLLHQHLRQEF